MNAIATINKICKGYDVWYTQDHRGHKELSAFVAGQRFSRVFIGYTIKEAAQLFYEQLEAEFKSQTQFMDPLDLAQIQTGIDLTELKKELHAHIDKLQLMDLLENDTPIFKSLEKAVTLAEQFKKNFYGGGQN